MVPSSRWLRSPAQGGDKATASVTQRWRDGEMPQVDTMPICQGLSSDLITGSNYGVMSQYWVMSQYRVLSPTPRLLPPFPQANAPSPLPQSPTDNRCFPRDILHRTPQISSQHTLLCTTGGGRGGSRCRRGHFGAQLCRQCHLPLRSLRSHDSSAPVFPASFPHTALPTYRTGFERIPIVLFRF